jgi:S1/P1 nuclease
MTVSEDAVEQAPAAELTFTSSRSASSTKDDQEKSGLGLRLTALQPPMKRLNTMIAVFVAILSSLPVNALAWNTPGYMLSGAIAYQILQRENPSTIPTVRSVLEKNPWYDSRWKSRLVKLPQAQRDEMLFMLAARWADDIRTKDRVLSHPLWYHISWPFKPQSEPETVHTMSPEAQNIVTAIVENERIVQSDTYPQRRAIALTWLFHLIGDIHQPLHTVSLFTREYPDGDRGGTRMCVRVAPDPPAVELHRLWDGLITSTNNIDQLRKIAAISYQQVFLIELQGTGS